MVVKGNEVLDINRDLLKCLALMALICLCTTGCTKSFKADMLYGKWEIVEFMPIGGEILYDDEAYVFSREGSILEFRKDLISYANVNVINPKTTIEFVASDVFIARYMITFPQLHTSGENIVVVEVSFNGSYITTSASKLKGARYLAFFVTEEGHIYLYDGGLVLRLEKCL